MKQVVDTTAPLEFDYEGQGLEWDEASYALNPVDRWCVQRARQLKRESPEIAVTAISVGPPRVVKALREAVSLGVDVAIRVDDAVFSDRDSFGTAWVLSRAIGQLAPDLVLCGDISLDMAAGSVGPGLAEMLGLPHVSSVADLRIDIDARSLIVKRQLERGYREVVQCPLPAVLSLAPPGGPAVYPSLPMVMRGLRYEVRTLRAEDLGLAGSGLADFNKTRLVAISPPRQRPKKTFLPDSSLSPAERMAQLLSGGVTARKTELLQGPPDSMAVAVIDFLRRQKVLP